MEIPSVLSAGDTWEWTDSLSDYPAGTWTLKYALRAYGLTPVDVAAVADGTDHKSTVTAEASSSVGAGVYPWVAFVERTVAGVVERKTVGEGTVTIKPYLFAAKSTTDNRSHARKMLDAIEAALEAAASDAGIIALTINGRSVQYKRDLLTRMRNDYRREVAKERGESPIIYEQFGSGR